MDPAHPLYDVCAEAIRVLDSALGPRACGAVVSGNAALGFRGIAGQESPYELTRRAAVAPVMRRMGYGEPRYGLDGTVGYGSTVLSMVPLNRGADTQLADALALMRRRGAGRGLATDGFGWILLEAGPAGPRVGCVADLRPFYVEALDMSRFKAAVPADPSYALRFLAMFGRPSPEGVAEGHDLVGEGVHGEDHPLHELVVPVGHGGAVGGRYDDPLLLHDLQRVPHPVLGQAGHLGEADEAYGLVLLYGPEDGDVPLEQLDVLAEGFDGVLRVSRSATLRIRTWKRFGGKGVGGPVSGRTTSACPTCCSCPTIPGWPSCSSRAPSARRLGPCMSCGTRGTARRVRALCQLSLREDYRRAY